MNSMENNLVTWLTMNGYIDELNEARSLPRPDGWDFVDIFDAHFSTIYNEYYGEL